MHRLLWRLLRKFGSQRPTGNIKHMVGVFVQHSEHKFERCCIQHGLWCWRTTRGVTDTNGTHAMSSADIHASSGFINCIIAFSPSCSRNACIRRGCRRRIPQVRAGFKICQMNVLIPTTCEGSCSSSSSSIPDGVWCVIIRSLRCLGWSKSVCLSRIHLQVFG